MIYKEIIKKASTFENLSENYEVLEGLRGYHRIFVVRYSNNPKFAFLG